MNKNNKKSNRFDLALISSVEASPQYGSTPEEGGKLVLMRNPIYISKKHRLSKVPEVKLRTLLLENSTFSITTLAYSESFAFLEQRLEGNLP